MAGRWPLHRPRRGGDKRRNALMITSSRCATEVAHQQADGMRRCVCWSGGQRYRRSTHGQRLARGFGVPETVAPCLPGQDTASGRVDIDKRQGIRAVCRFGVRVGQRGPTPVGETTDSGHTVAVVEHQSAALHSPCVERCCFCCFSGEATRRQHSDRSERTNLSAAHVVGPYTLSRPFTCSRASR